MTGGASGIGRAICEVLASEGAKVALLDLSDECAAEAVDEIRRSGGSASWWHCDVTDEEAVEDVFAEMVQRFGGLNILVNNAAIAGTPRLAHEATEEEFDRIFAVNVKGTWLCTKHALRHMLDNDGGSVINVSSINGIIGNLDIPLYHATKGAVRIMSKTDAVAYAGRGVRVNSVHPGSVRTPLSEKLAQDFPGGPEEYFRGLTEAHPVGRQGEPEEIAHGVLYLASDESKFVTGAELVIDGGYTAQ